MAMTAKTTLESDFGGREYARLRSRMVSAGAQVWRSAWPGLWGMVVVVGIAISSLFACAGRRVVAGGAVHVRDPGGAWMTHRDAYEAESSEGVDDAPVQSGSQTSCGVVDCHLCDFDRVVARGGRTWNRRFFWTAVCFACRLRSPLLWCS